MALRLDALLLRAVVTELDAVLRGAALRKIAQLNETDLLLTFWSGENHFLLISLAPEAARVHLVEGKSTSQPPGAFCMLLRKHLEGARVMAVETWGLERILHLHLRRGPDDVVLAVELTVMERNVVLGGKVRGSWHAAKGVAVRSLSEPPPVGAGLTGDGPAWRVLASGILGLNRAAAVEVCVTAGQAPDEPVRDLEALSRAWEVFRNRLEAGRFAATWYPDRKIATPWPYTSLANETNIQYESFSAMFNTLWGTDWSERRVSRLRADLLARLSDARDKLERRLRAQRENLEALTDVERWQRQGELLLSAVGAAARNGEVSVVDYRQDPPQAMQVSVDARLSVSENAQACFSRYKKGLRGRTALAEQLARGDLERRWLDELQTAVETASSDADLHDVAQQFKGVRPGPVEKRRARPGVVRRAPIRSYRIEGYQVLVGRNPRENEEITLRMAEPDDVWLHARQVPGAHVVIRGAGPPEAVLLAAAALAAANSGARTAAKVAVDYTRARYVRKVPGAPAGLVTYRQEKTLMVRPGLVQQ